MMIDARISAIQGLVIVCAIQGLVMTEKLALWLVQEFKICVFGELGYSLGYKLKICMIY